MKTYQVILAGLLLFGLRASAKADAESKRFGRYTVTIEDTTDDQGDSVGQTLTITKNRNQVFQVTGERYYFGTGADSDQPEDIYSGTDITGRGVPNLVFTTFSGGAHCCFTLNIFEMGDNFRQVLSLDGQDSPFKLIDLDGDGYPEIEFGDGPINYQFSSFAGSPFGRVVMKFDGRTYKLSAALMIKPLPSAGEMAQIRSDIRQEFQEHDQDSDSVPSSLLKAMMDLCYTGHFNDALKLATTSWPPQKLGLAKFRKDFYDGVMGSEYIQELYGKR